MKTYQPALSPSRAKDYLQCPLKFRFAVVDRIPQPPTEATMKGTLVHAVLENLFALPQKERTPEAATEMVRPQWEKLKEENPSYREICTNDGIELTLIHDAFDLIRDYFNIEQPANLAPARTEESVLATLPSGLHLRGIIDRVDRAPDGRLRVVDYKTGKAPSPRYVDEALFQMRYYALLLRLTDRLPSRTQLLYLKTGKVLTLDPDNTDIDRFSDEVNALWGRIRSDLETQSFAPKRGPLCNWCAFQSRCPLFGGSPEPLAEADINRVLKIQTQPDSE